MRPLHLLPIALGLTDCSEYNFTLNTAEPTSSQELQENDTAAPDSGSEPEPEPVELKIGEVFKACNLILNNDTGHCVSDAETGEYDEDCEWSVDAQGTMVRGQWYAGLSAYWGADINEYNVENLPFTVLAFNDDDRAYAASLVIGPGHHPYLYSQGGWIPVQDFAYRTGVPFWQCISWPLPNGADHQSHTLAFEGLEAGSAEFSWDGSPGSSSATINGTRYDCESGDYSCAPSETASERILDEMYDLTETLTDGSGEKLRWFN